MSDHEAAIGIFGGTFDPVHFGHLRAAVEVREKLSLADLRLLPAGTPPHRDSTGANAGHRLAMLRLAIGEAGCLSVDDREVRRGGRSYMVDTLAEIRSENPRSPLLLIIGQDAANQLDQWHEWRRLFELAHLVVMRRPDSVSRYSEPLSEVLGPRFRIEFESLGCRPAGRVLPLEVTQLAISATDIRQRIREGRSPRFLLPDAVIHYIQKHGLYVEK